MSKTLKRTVLSTSAAVGQHTCAGAAVACEVTTAGLLKLASVTEAAGKRCRQGEDACRRYRDHLDDEVEAAIKAAVAANGVVIVDAGTGD